MAVWCNITPLRANFQSSLFNFHADLSRYNEMRVHCTRYKTPTLSTAILRPFGPGRQNFNARFHVSLHKPVKFYPDLLRLAGVIREKPIFSKCILRCHAFA